MKAGTWGSLLLRQSSNSLILASISREGDSLLVVALFFILFAPLRYPQMPALCNFRKQGELGMVPPDLSLSAPIPAPVPQRTAATRPWRPRSTAADPAGSPTAPCRRGYPSS